jgi:putative RecB family exonuclease
VTSFRDCALAFRFNSIEHLPDEPTVWTVKGTLVHRALERLFWFNRRGERTPAAGTIELAHAWEELQTDPEFLALALSPEDAESLHADAVALVRNYFALEDPNEINPVGVELTLEARVGDMRLRGIIDRLDLTPDGELVVIDYKTGRAPSAAFEQSKMIGVHIYALLCLEVLGRRPVQVKLLHLKEPTTIIAEPSEQALRGQRNKAVAVWTAIERACATEDFRPRTSPLCNYCRFRAFCPAYGGDPAEAAASLGVGVAIGGAP